MDIKEIEQFVKENMIQGISEVLSGEKDDVGLPFVRPNDVIEYLKTIGYDGDFEFDSNGWQCDFWIYINFKGNKYILSGDAFYEKNCGFSKKE